MLDIRAILTLTEPARCHQDRMARLEFRDDLHRLLRSYEERNALPTPLDGSPPMRLRSALLATLRAFEDVHGMERSVPERRRREAA